MASRLNFLNPIDELRNENVERLELLVRVWIEKRPDVELENFANYLRAYQQHRAAEMDWLNS